MSASRIKNGFAVFLGLTAAAWSAGAVAKGPAAPLPADCSAAPAPTQPVAVAVGGIQFTPTHIKLRASGSQKTETGEFDTYELSLRSENSTMAPLEAHVTVMVLKGERVDGRVFRRLATKDSDRQPTVSKQSSEVEVQGWSFENRPASVDLNHAEYLASLRLEFGQRKGDVIPGNIRLCMGKGQTSMFNKKPTKDDNHATGTFEARIEQ